MADIIVITPEGRSWVIKHNNGVIGHVRELDEANRLAKYLVSCIEAQGRTAELKVVDDSVLVNKPEIPLEPGPSA